MKDLIAKVLLSSSLFAFALATVFMAWRAEPFYTYYYLFAWWSYIFAADSWLYLKGGESLLIGRLAEFFTFLLPLSAFFWFVFEAFNLRLHNWRYIGVPREIWIRWPFNFLAFGSVLPAIFVTGNLLDHYGAFRRNDFSHFFSSPLPRMARIGSLVLGGLMLILPLVHPEYFFPLVWGGLVLLLDPINAFWSRRSLIQEWRQGNWNRTLQLLFAGLICGGLWELWNFWAGAKWVYIVPLPERLLEDLKIFEMPIFGFLGFPPFALECFAAAEFASGIRERSPRIWKILVLLAVVFSLAVCALMDIYTVERFR